MNKELLESQWVQARELLRDKWGSLTEEDIRQINGRYDQLVAKLQQRYGYSREEAEDELRKWVIDKNARSFNQDRTFSSQERSYGERPYSSQEKSYVNQAREDEFARSKKNDSSSLLKWLLLAGIPLVLLASYLAHENSKAAEDRFANQSATAPGIIETPVDQSISRNIRNALLSNDMISNDAKNIRVETNNGIVTLSGTVASAQEKNAIFRVTQNISGVKQVNDQLIVR